MIYLLLSLIIILICSSIIAQVRSSELLRQDISELQLQLHDVHRRVNSINGGSTKKIIAAINRDSNGLLQRIFKGNPLSKMNSKI